MLVWFNMLVVILKILFGIKVVILNVVTNIANILTRVPKIQRKRERKPEMVVLQVAQITVMFSRKDWSHQNVRKFNLIVLRICRKR